VEDSPEKSGADPTGHTRRTRTFELETMAVVSGAPVLSDRTKRKLAILWDGLREKHDITEQDVSGYDRGRQWLMGMLPKQGSIIGYSLVDRKRAAQWLGVGPSVQLAERLFREIDYSEYWKQWCSSGEPYETYAAWLDMLKRDIVAKLESIWIGHSAVSDRWFEEICKPAIEEELSALIKGGNGRIGRITQARGVEMARLEKAHAKARTRRCDKGGRPRLGGQQL
jgi:hypothetical protein